MEDVFVNIVVGILRSVTFIYDIITYIPWHILDSPHKKLKASGRVKAAPLSSDRNAAYRSTDSFDELTTSIVPECETLDDLFGYAVRAYTSNPCLGTREVFSEEDEVQPNGKVFKKLILGNYTWQSYEDVLRRASNFGSGLLALGARPRQNVLIFAETRAEWFIAAQACFKYNFPVVTLYATLGEEAIIHGVNESEVTHVITSNDLITKFKNILGKMPRVTHLVYMDQGKKPKLDGFSQDVNILTMSAVENLGQRPENIKTPVTKPTKDDLAVIMYTSGSTGLPKGVLITHGNLMCGMSGQTKQIQGLGPADTYIGYLPLAHVLELSAELACICNGTRIGYSSPNTLSDQSSKIKRGTKGDARILKPTLMAAVPVIMDRLYKAVWEKVNEGGPLHKALFTFAFEYKKARYTRGYDVPIFTRIVFKRVRRLLGGKVRLMLSGGAPLSEDTQRFMNICFCCPVGQGYGLTETCGAGTISEAGDLSTGRVGAPLSCNDIRLRDWEEGGYTSDDVPCPRGEILIGGGNVTMGYYKNPKKTKEDFFEEAGMRWFCTGDIGEFHEDGCLKIIDRKKDLVKLQAGEYVSLAKVEMALKLVPLVDNVCLYADSKTSYTIALVVPNRKQLNQLAEEHDIETSDFSALCENKTVVKEVLTILQKSGLKAKLERFEIPQKIKLCTDVWTADNGLVTDAFKLKRRNIKDHYEKDIKQMYA